MGVEVNTQDVTRQHEEAATLEELQKEFLGYGGKLDKNLENRLINIEDIALKKYQNRQTQAAIDTEQRPEWAQQAADLAGKGLAIVSLLFTFVFVLGGLFIGTLVLLAAELIAVHDGFAVVDPKRAWLYATAIVLFYVVILFIEQIVIDREGYTPSKKMSLNTIKQDFEYFVGKGKSWEVQYKQLPSSSQHIMRTVQVSTYSIIAFGLLGRLEGKIAEYNHLAWHESGVEILLNSSLSDMFGYIGMLVATTALLWGTKWVIHFIYNNFRSVTGGVAIQDFSNASIVTLSPTAMIEAEKLLLMKREILKLKARN